MKVVRGRIVRSIFLLGRPKDEKIAAKIKGEQEEYRDILMEDFSDTYNNLTLKVLMGMKWASQHCSDASWVMKVDDDVYVDLANTVDFLERLPTSVKTMSGHMFQTARPIRDKTSKWFVTKTQYTGSVYPDYFCGMCYIMSGDLPRLFYEDSTILPYFFHRRRLYWHIVQTT
ncbi:hypothetical protein BSL78_27813 [Apostichopus japonicus]|uniref:Hexosyltransferase n=1 Tax=Stichopus japonicus TaxID=307972 RepID=A0A2G8JHY1_STIJA|nr:hypothetical protein BSL78_27813 [Apostichopus japonicus]